MTLANGHGREINPIRDVSDRIDAGHARAVIGIDLDLPPLSERNADLVQSQPWRVGAAADGEHDLVDLESGAIAEVSDKALVGPIDAPKSGVRQHLNAALGICLHQAVAQVLVEAAQQLPTP